MASFNKVILMGNLTRDPELRYTPNGKPIAKLGLAVNRTWRTEQGDQREEVTFVDVDVFGRTAENVGQYMRKGRPILIEGRLKLDQWEDRNTGQKRSKMGVVAETVQFLGGRDDNRGGGGGGGGGGYQDGGNYGGGGGGGGYNEPPSNQPPSSPRPAPAPYDDGPPPDDDVPF
ncbi:MAG: single-stranded DNA-binding protein [Limisphaerales bacterium]